MNSRPGPGPGLPVSVDGVNDSEKIAFRVLASGARIQASSDGRRRGILNAFARMFDCEYLAHNKGRYT